MKIAFTLDYELFLGAKTGSVYNCLINPLDALLSAIEPVNAHFTIFVDATYLYRIYHLMSDNDDLKKDYKLIVDHLSRLRDNGEDIQLHIHPHWHYSQYSNGEWQLDHNHYKLSDLAINEAKFIVKESKDLLDNILGYKTTIFRAGGFSAQPTELLTTIFSDNNIVADSTVCPGTSYDSPQQKYDYVTAPKKDYYRFEKDICSPQSDGSYTEYPFTMYRVSPVFHWKLAYNRIHSSDIHKKYGDGVAVKTTNDSIIKRLTSYYDCPATIDGYKANFLSKAYKNAKKRGLELFTVLGHPKLATPYSINIVREFVTKVVNLGDTFVTLTEISNE